MSKWTAQRVVLQINSNTRSSNELTDSIYGVVFLRFTSVLGCSLRKCAITPTGLDNLTLIEFRCRSLALKHTKGIIVEQLCSPPVICKRLPPCLSFCPHIWHLQIRQQYKLEKKNHVQMLHQQKKRSVNRTLSAAARTPRGGPLHFGCIFHMSISMWTSCLVLLQILCDCVWPQTTDALKGLILYVYNISDTSGNKTWVEECHTYICGCLPLELGNISRREYSSFTVLFMFYSHWSSHQNFTNRHNSTCKCCRECEMLSQANLIQRYGRQSHYNKRGKMQILCN